MAIEDTRGDFRKRRGPLPWQPGMMYGRLLDAGKQVVAEDTLPAPDAKCVVLDPHLLTPDGAPSPTQFTADGPVVFQLRLPKVDSATHLKIYRLTGHQPAAANEEPAGLLLATISIKP